MAHRRHQPSILRICLTQNKLIGNIYKCHRVLNGK